jgi:uncharacterized protein
MFSGTTQLTKEPPNVKVTRTVGLISDTHVPKRAHDLPQKVFQIFEKVDYIVHAGDLVEISVVDELEQIAPVLAVQGNMDGVEVADAFPRMNSLKVLDWKIGVMHDPDVAFGFDKMRELIKQNGFNVFVYGHTHVANVTWEEKTLYINPGSPTVPASIMSKPSVAILKITKEKVVPELINL